MNNELKETNASEPTKLVKLQEMFFQGLKDKGRSANTLKNYRTDLECFNKYLTKEQRSLSLEQFQLEQVQQYGHYLQNKYTSDNSRRRRLQTLRVFFDFLVQQSLFNTNPVRKIPTSPKFLDRPRPTSFVDIKTLWSHLLNEEYSGQPMAQLSTKRNQVITLLIFGGGLKVSDLASLKNNQIFIPSNEENAQEKPPRVLITPIKREPYTVELPKVFTPVYKSYVEELEHMKEKSNIEFDQLLFNANPYRILSGGLSVRGTEIIFEDLRKKLMITVTPKSLRQACIFHWLHLGLGESQIKEWMGVAPSYSLKMYKEYLSEYAYSIEFLEELYLHYQLKNSRLHK